MISSIGVGTLELVDVDNISQGRDLKTELKYQASDEKTALKSPSGPACSAVQ